MRLGIVVESLDRLEAVQARSSGTLQNWDLDQFRIAPTCPPTTRIVFRGGLVWRPPTAIGSYGWFIPSYEVDLADGEGWVLAARGLEVVVRAVEEDPGDPGLGRVPSDAAEALVAHRHDEDRPRRGGGVQQVSDLGELGGEVGPAPVGLQLEAGVPGRGLRVLAGDLLELVVGVDEAQRDAL